MHDMSFPCCGQCERPRNDQRWLPLTAESGSVSRRPGSALQPERCSAAGVVLEQSRPAEPVAARAADRLHLVDPAPRDRSLIVVARAANRRKRPPKRPASGDVDYLSPDSPLSLTLYLRHRLPVRRRPGSAIDLSELKRRVTQSELRAERRRILKRSVERIRRFAERRGMTVIAVNFLGRRVRLRASAAAAERAFGTRLAWIRDGGVWRYYPCYKPRIPTQLKTIVHAVLGLDTRKPRLSRLRENASAGNGIGLLPSEMARLYGLDRGGRGQGQCIAIIEPAGGYRPDDIVKACQAMQIAPPQIVDVNVGSGRNRPGPNPRADAEVALGIQVVAGVAPEARIVVYFTELSEPGLVAGVSRAVQGPERPNVVIITWGEPETLWPAESRLGLDPVLQDAVRLGITVLATAGDDLASERMQERQGLRQLSGIESLRAGLRRNAHRARWRARQHRE